MVPRVCSRTSPSRSSFASSRRSHFVAEGELRQNTGPRFSVRNRLSVFQRAQWLMMRPRYSIRHAAQRRPPLRGAFAVLILVRDLHESATDSGYTGDLKCIPGTKVHES
jgi:hypothetical protein